MPIFTTMIVTSLSNATALCLMSRYIFHCQDIGTFVYVDPALSTGKMRRQGNFSIATTLSIDTTYIKRTS